MARARNIKPGFFLNDEIVELRYEVRLLFIGLWLLADREGRLEDRPKKIKMSLFPADDIDIEGAISELGANKFVRRYEVDNIKYIQVVNFLKHQKPHHQEKKSTYPPPPISDEGANHFARYRPDSLIPDSLIPDSLIPDSLIDDAVVSSPPSENFDPDASLGKSKPVDDWQPSPDTLEALEKIHGIPDKFITEQIAEFKIYWRDRGSTAVSWDSKFNSRCASQWKRDGHNWTEKPKRSVRDIPLEERLTDRSWAEGPG